MSTTLFTFIGLAGVAAAQSLPVKLEGQASTPTKAQVKCEMVATTGSRLAKQRVCHDPALRSQLDQERREFERIRQTSRPRIGD